jgi:hypothetical protein
LFSFLSSVVDLEKEMKANALAVLGLATVLAACAATGPGYEEYIAALPEVPRESTRLTVFRTVENTQYSARAATVRIDGREAGSCDFGGYQTFYVNAGPHALTVQMWDAPGTCRLSTHVIGGEEYFFEISPRAENWVSGFLGALVGAMGGAASLAGAPFAAMGYESAGKECGGAFSIVAVEEGAARQKLKDLHLSR